MQLQIDLSEKANKNVELYKALMSKKNKAQAANEMLEKFEIKVKE